MKVIPHCPFWVFPSVNAVSKKSSLSHPFDGFPHVNARFTECFFITYDLDIVEIIAFCWWAAILLNAKRYSRKIISAWQRWKNISWTGRTLFLTPGTQKLPHPNGTQGYPRPSGSYPGTKSYWHTGTTPLLVWQTKYVKCIRAIANHIFNTISFGDKTMLKVGNRHWHTRIDSKTAAFHPNEKSNQFCSTRPVFLS